MSEDATDVIQKLRIYDNEIETLKSLNLLGLEIDYQIKFNEHICTLSSKPASNRTLCIDCNSLWVKLQKYAIINNFIFSNLNYYPLV